MPAPDPTLIEHLDEALDHVLAARLRAGAPPPATVPTEVVEAAFAGDDNYREARRNAANALGLVLAAVEDDEAMI